MAFFACQPNKVSPPTHIWFCVETPAAFREYKLPANNATWTRADRRKFRELQRLAEDHGTYIQRNGYRRG
jgi:hypothetical protein